jgi:hypothetical protein
MNIMDANYLAIIHYGDLWFSGCVSLTQATKEMGSRDEKEQKGHRNKTRPPDKTVSTQWIARKQAWTLGSAKPIRPI